MITTDIQTQRRRDFGTMVADTRREKGMTQEELAHAAGMDRAYMGRVERGEVSVGLDKIWAVADALGTTPGKLFG